MRLLVLVGVFMRLKAQSYHFYKLCSENTQCSETGCPTAWPMTSSSFAHIGNTHFQPSIHQKQSGKQIAMSSILRPPNLSKDFDRKFLGVQPLDLCVTVFSPSGISHASQAGPSSSLQRPCTKTSGILDSWGPQKVIKTFLLVAKNHVFRSENLCFSWFLELLGSWWFEPFQKY